MNLPDRGAASSGLVEATKRSLADAGREDTPLAAAAMLLAERLDRVGQSDTGAAVAALVKEYRATVAEAVKDADRADDPLEDIRGAAALKLIRRSA